MQTDGKEMRHSASVFQSVLAAGLVALFLAISAVAGMVVFDQVRQYIAASDTLPPFTNPGPGGSQSDNPGPDASSSDSVWEGKERVNILVMGIDQRAGEEGAFRTDTMMVLTLDPVTKTGGVLSIPRDLWVPIPGYSVARINTAHFYGQRDNYPGGGPVLAAKTVQNNLGVPIHHYARVDFNAFVELVDRIGGIDVYVEEEIDDPKYPSHDPADPYGYAPLHIEPGQHHFDGEMALKYARTRSTAGSDFDRADRQQRVMKAIFKKVTRLNMLPTLIAQAPGMWRTLQGSVETDLTLDQIIALARLASQVDLDNVSFAAIDEEYTIPYETDDGAKVLILLRDKTRELRDELFTSEEVSQEEGVDGGSQLEQEAATIEVLNGTLTTGLAADATELLRQENLNVAHTGNADRQDIDDSLVVAHTGKTYTAQYIAELLGLPESAVVQGSEPTAEYDISVILGADYRPPE